jgi:hypothetical protein
MCVDLVTFNQTFLAQLQLVKKQCNYCICVPCLQFSSLSFSQLNILHKTFSINDNNLCAHARDPKTDEAYAFICVFCYHRFDDKVQERMIANRTEVIGSEQRSQWLLANQRVETSIFQLALRRMT